MDVAAMPGDREWLLAVLINPPAASTGTRTRNAVLRAGQVLGYDDVRLVNLYVDATPSVLELDSIASPEGWINARPALRRHLHAAGAVLGAWGVSGITRRARQARDEQVLWVRAEALAARHTHMWMVGGEPRHPSRWHQFVADKHGRTTEGAFEERLRQVIQPMRL